MVDYWPTNIDKNPMCPHGPTLLFSRKNNGRKFFACSAFRDRKKCSFFQWFDIETNSRQYSITAAVESDIRPSTVRSDSRKELNDSSEKKFYCCTCDTLILCTDLKCHENHNVDKKIGNRLLFPSSAMKTIEESKGESQFHFCDSTVNTLISFFQQQNISSVLCIGCPRLHECLLNKEKTIDSMLLDIDSRYQSFYSPYQFQLFNMFNCHFFDTEGRKYVEAFVKNSSQLALIIDPPFGGRIEALKYTFHRIISLDQNVNHENKNILLLPYFMESAVRMSFPDISMLDYKVEYRNHRRFQKRENSSVKGSAVRIFTNYSPTRFILPGEEGYKYCTHCDRWTFKENKHCFVCKSCTSKNGGRYQHCNICNKCVKVTWKHCSTCKICKLLNHNCSPNANADAKIETDFKVIAKKRKRNRKIGNGAETKIRKF